MVKVRDISGWAISPAMLFGKSPKIEYICGEVNDTGLRL